MLKLLKRFLPSMINLIGNSLQLTETKYCTHNSRYLPFCDKVYFVPTWSLFADPITFNYHTLHSLLLICCVCQYLPYKVIKYNNLIYSHYSCHCSHVVSVNTFHIRCLKLTNLPHNHTFITVVNSKGV